ncbi:protein of unknown function [Mesonia phycicola]|uniref:DUF3857 domain-containing protein n=1 Tax=Mesonia phycicola TaxID=579105 RepID=A0A1M6C2G0_9FLAO|nr:DUF3857 domain-containing protein [Mesonia phycicola]SHI54944.1 protein of unknown function [Mesonia phycicola]
MKKITYLLLIFFLKISIASAQDEKIAQKFWDGSQADNLDIPDKWRNESAVILFQEYNYGYEEPGKRVRYTKSIHKRIKLLDKAAVEEFSEFNFVKSFKVSKGFFDKGGNQVLGIKIIKPSKEEKIISIEEEAIKNDKDEYKIAIPGLEVGDIIDYFAYKTEEFKSDVFLFDVNTEILSDYYPCKQYVFELKTTKDFFLNFGTYNGAPEIEEVETKKRKERKYVFVAHDIEKNDFPMWFYPQVELPFYKFQLTYGLSVNNADNAYHNFLSKDIKEVKSTVTQEDVLNFFSYPNRYRKLKISKHLKKFSKKYLKGKTLSKEEQVEETYYFLRHFVLTQYIQPTIISKLDVKNTLSPFDYYYQKVGGRILVPSTLNNQFKFCLDFAGFLSANEIPFELLVAMPKFKGGVEELISIDEVELLLKINFEKPIYISYYDKFSTLTANSPFLENTEVYALPYDNKKKEISDIYKLTIPESKANENSSLESMSVSFEDNFSTINLDTENVYKGHLKSTQQENLLYFFDYVEEDNKRFNNPNYFERILSNKKRTRHREKYDAFLDKIKKKREDYMLDRLNNSYQFTIKDQNTEILDTGRKSDSSFLKYKCHFTVENDLIKKAGPNFIFEVGKLNGDQITLDKNERDRELNVYMNFPRSYASEIIVEIPQGYKVLGVEKLAINKSNLYAEFVSTSKIQGNQLIITTKKTYKKSFIEKENWNQLLEVLDASLDFNKQKVLFEKI